jgi:hypothetical protein
VRNVLFSELSYYSCIKLAMGLGWWSRKMWKDGVEFPFFLLNIGVLCEGGSTRGLDSWTWSKTCQYFALTDDVVCRSKPWDSILTYPEIAGLEAIQKEFQKFQAINYIFSVTWTSVPSIITLIWCRTHFFFKNCYSSLLHLYIFAVFIVVS